MSDPLDLTTLGITDEAVAIEATSDFFKVAPRDQRVADGEDGAFTSADRWSLGWADHDFGSLGVAPGMMVEIELPIVGSGYAGKSTTRRSPDHLVAQAIGADSTLLVLRRKGFGSNVGSPPGPVAGTGNVKFKVVSVLPQIRVSADKIRRKFGITSADKILQPGDFDRAIVCDVLANLYFAQSRMNGEPAADDFAAKARTLKAEYVGLLEGLDAQYNDASLPGSDWTISTPTPRYGCGWLDRRW